MTRIIAGQWGGRQLRTPRGDSTRPTSDRVREALFSSVSAELGGFEDLRVLDLFAGSGALGLEALSRGAEHATLVEHDRRTADVIRANAKDLGASATVRAMKVDVFLAGGEGPYDLVFADPPYAQAIEATLVALVPHLADDALVIVERSSRTPFAWPDGYDALRDKKYGETHVWQARASVGSTS